MFLFLFACQHNISIGSPPSDDPSSNWATVIKEVSTVDGVDYEALQKRRTELEEYLAWVGDNGPRMNRRKNIRWRKRDRENKKIAFYANAYNAWVLYSILETLPRDTVEEIHLKSSGLFPTAFLIDGEYMSLTHVKEERLLGDFQEPLINIMLFDGSRSSPPLRFWGTEQFDIVLKNQFERYLNSPQGIQHHKGEIELPALFENRINDFIDWSLSDSLCEYLMNYSLKHKINWEKEAQKGCTISYRPYDWTLAAESKN